MTTFSTTASAALATDFTASTKDPTYRRWTPGKMRHLIAALDNQPVTITVDSMTGHTLTNVRLLAVTNPTDYPGVLIESRYTDGTTDRTSYPLGKLGQAIICPNGSPDAKWKALDTYRDEASAAIAYVRATDGEAAGRAWGVWHGTPTDRGVAVTYTPSTGNPDFADQWGTHHYAFVPLSKITA